MSRTIVFIGKSGEQYRFQIWSLGTTFKPVAAVYIVTKRTTEDRTFATKGTHRPVMIGSTDNLAAPIFTDSQLKAFSARGAEHICVRAEPDAEERARVERDLIDGHNEVGGFLHRLLEPTLLPQKT